MLVRAHTEVLDSLTGVPFASEEEGISTSRGTKSELVECQNLAARADDASTSATSYTQRGEADGWDSRQADVICNGSYNDNNRCFRRLRAGELLGDFRD